MLESGSSVRGARLHQGALASVKQPQAGGRSCDDGACDSEIIKIFPSKWECVGSPLRSARLFQ